MPLSNFPVTRRWPPVHADRLQYYGLATPNGQKVSVMLEELGLPYDAHRISISDAQPDQFTPEFISISPNSKIPAILDPDGPGGEPIGIFETGAILIYLADKTGRFLSPRGRRRYEIIQWLMWQMGGVGPMFGQVGYFHKYKGSEIADPRPRERYYNESHRLLGVLDRLLVGRDWMCGDYSIADMAVAPWVKNLRDGYKAGKETRMDEFAEVARWLEAWLTRPAVQKGLTVCE